MFAFFKIYLFNRYAFKVFKELNELSPDFKINTVDELTELMDRIVYAYKDKRKPEVVASEIYTDGFVKSMKKTSRQK